MKQYEKKYMISREISINDLRLYWDYFDDGNYQNLVKNISKSICNFIKEDKNTTEKQNDSIIIVYEIKFDYRKVDYNDNFRNILLLEYIDEFESIPQYEYNEQTFSLILYDKIFN